MGKYIITEPLGAGTAGKVFLARDPETGEHHVLKRGAGADRLALGLRHAHIVGVRETADGELVQEYVDGSSLQAVLAAGRPALAQSAGWMRQLLDALDYLHASGIVHRDIKPANLLLTQQGDLKLADFGIASRIGDTVRGNPLSGTPNYMAPEQMRGAAPDPRADLYSVAVVFYQLLTGSLPHSGTAFEVMQQVLHEDALPPSRRCPELPPAADRLLLRALSRDPGRRPGSAYAFLQDLNSIFLL